MIKRGSGNVIVTGATASLRGMPFTSAFASAKAAQKSLAQSVARDLVKRRLEERGRGSDRVGRVNDDDVKATGVLFQEKSAVLVVRAHLWALQLRGDRR